MDLFSRSEREKELQDFDAVWPANKSPQEIIDDFLQACKKQNISDVQKITYQHNGMFMIKFNCINNKEFTAEQIISATERLNNFLKAALDD
jgi:hypothetical protein